MLYLLVESAHRIPLVNNKLDRHRGVYPPVFIHKENGFCKLKYHFMVSFLVKQLIIETIGTQHLGRVTVAQVIYY